MLKEEGDEGAKAKFQTQPLYTLARTLCSTSVQPLKLTGFGELQPVTEDGQHKFEIGNNGRDMDFS